MKGTLIKYKNTGTEDPFNARMMFGVMKLRDALVKSDKERLEFDNLYSPVFESLDDCLECKKQLLELVAKHRGKIQSKEIVGFQNNGAILEIHESIDREMNKLFKDFFIKGEIALKGLQKLCKRYDLDIGFFFQDDKKFKKRADALVEKDPNIKTVIEMLTNDRQWYSVFNEIRNQIEHHGFSPGNVKYQHSTGSEVVVLIPKINGKEIDKVVKIMSANISDFIEDLIAMTINRKIAPFYVVTIPEDRRDPSLPLKYTISIDGLRVY